MGGRLYFSLMYANPYRVLLLICYKISNLFPRMSQQTGWDDTDIVVANTADCFSYGGMCVPVRETSTCLLAAFFKGLNQILTIAYQPDT